MKDSLYDALQTLADFDAVDFKAPFYRSLLVGDVSDALAELSFVECCGVLSSFYDASGYYPQIQGGDIYSYLKETDDYLTPLGLLVLSRDLHLPLFTLLRRSVENTFTVANTTDLRSKVASGAGQ